MIGITKLETKKGHQRLVGVYSPNNLPFLQAQIIERIYINISNGRCTTIEELSLLNVLLFTEVGLRDVGNFDFVLVKHKPLSSEVEDFCIVEFETDSTTQTGKLVAALKDFIGGVDVSARRYNYGMNTYNTIKLSYIQMLYKGQVLQKWNKKIVWICQAYVFENMVNRFNLSDLDYESRNSTLYFVYDLVRLGDNYKLQNVYKKSSTIDNLLKAFTEQPAPNVNEFINILERKIRLDLGITFT